MELSSVNVYILLALCLSSLAAASKDYEMTVRVKPGVAECFYAPFKGGEEVEFDYQVINGEYGELDIDVFVFNEQQNLIKSDSRSAEGSHSLDISEAGDYKFCMDNSFSRMSAKTVFFALFITSTEDPAPARLNDASDRPWLEPPQMYEMKVEDIKDALTRIHGHTSKARQTQDRIMAALAKDRNVAENNFSRINFFSCVCIGVMITTGVIQVVLLRSLFDDQSKLHKLWKSEDRRYWPRVRYC